MSINELIGFDTVKGLTDASRNRIETMSIGQLVMDTCRRDRELIPFVRINVLMAMIKSACLSHLPHVSQLTGDAERLIKSLNFDEPTRIHLYQGLFDKEIMYKQGIVIYRG